MTRDDIIQMAQEAGWEMPVEWDAHDGFLQRLERFAALVAAAEIGLRAALQQEAKDWKCFCDENGLGVPGVTCGDCPRDYKTAATRSYFQIEGQAMTDRRAALDEVHQSMHEEYHGTMARNEMIRLAREAGASPLHGGEVALFGAAAIERFAELVAEREALKRQKKFVECMCGLCKLEEPQ